MTTCVSIPLPPFPLAGDALRGEIDPEYGPSGGVVFRLDGAALLLDQLPADGEPQAGPLRLGREKRLEYVSHDPLVNPFAAVGYFDPDAIRKGIVFRPDRQHAPA